MNKLQELNDFLFGTIGGWPRPTSRAWRSWSKAAGIPVELPRSLRRAITEKAKTLENEGKRYA